MESIVSYLQHNWLELLASTILVFGVWLTARRNILCWPVGIVGTGMAAFVYFEYLLYSDMILYIIYMMLLGYGWYAWLYGGRGKTPLPVARMSKRWFGIALGAGAVSTLGLGTFMATRTDADLPFWDAATTSFSLVTQVIQARKLIDCWGFWIVINMVAIGMYLYKGLFFFAAIHVIYQFLAVYGFLQWQKVLHSPETE